MTDFERVRTGLALLEERTPYVVAKAPDISLNLARGGDIDLLVGDVDKARNSLIDIFGPPLREIRTLYAIAFFFEWGEIDIMLGLHWRGVRLAKTGTVLAERRVSTDNLFIARPAHQIISACLYPKLSYGFHKAEYEAVFDSAIENDYARTCQILTAILGRRTAQEVLDRGGFTQVRTSKLRVAVLVRALRNPIRWSSILCFFGKRAIQKAAALNGVTRSQVLGR